MRGKSTSFPDPRTSCSPEATISGGVFENEGDQQIHFVGPYLTVLAGQMVKEGREAVEGVPLVLQAPEIARIGVLVLSDNFLTGP